MRVCIVGSGISGLSAAYYLLKSGDVNVTVYEQASVFGGRANVTHDGEHCARLFLQDYTHLFPILRDIESPDGRSVYDTLRPVTRYHYSAAAGWVEMSHLYSMLATEVSPPERCKVALASMRVAFAARRTSPLLAEQLAGANTNTYGSWRNYSPASMIKLAASLLRSKAGYVLEGPTDECLIRPWVRLLETRGVTFQKGAPVRAIRPDCEGVTIYTEGGAARFNAVVVTAFVSDMTALLEASGLEHSVKRLKHTHCKCFTLTLDPRESILSDGRPGLYSRNGITVVVQPNRGRCVVICTYAPSTHADYVLARVRELLDLGYEIADVGVRDNLLPDEAIYIGDYVDPTKVLKRRTRHVYFAGSYIKNSYPADSGEGAARSAFDAVQRIETAYNLGSDDHGRGTASLRNRLRSASTLAPLRYALLDRALERGLVPDRVLRVGAQYGARARQRREERGGAPAQADRLSALVAHMSSGPVAEAPEKANEHHYELPAEFFGVFLGPRRKYSSCLWPDGVADLRAAEEAMLDLTCRRAGVRHGMEILDLGCGWGALSIWLAERYDVRVVGVSNSRRQRDWVAAERDRRGLTDRLEIVTADINQFDPSRVFDRVVSVEMFEHIRNWSALLARVASWLKVDGKAFVHVFSHRRLAYRFEGTWAAERFFTAGTMPSHALMLHFSDDLVVTERWTVGGGHYAKTLAAWLQRLDANAERALSILRVERSESDARRLLATWRLFLISTAEMWSSCGGDAWMISHYLLEPRGGSGKNPLVRAT